MGDTCSVYVSQERPIQGLGGETQVKEANWMTQAQTGLITYLLHKQNFLEQLKFSQIVKKFQAIYGNRRFINLQTPYDPLKGRAARHLTVTQSRTSPKRVANMCRILKGFCSPLLSPPAMQVASLKFKRALWCEEFFPPTLLSHQTCLHFSVNWSMSSEF